MGFGETLTLNGEANQPGLIPGLTWLRAYQKQWFRMDVIAGLIAAAVVIPKAMAFATIAGLPVQVGLYTVFVPMVIYALLGTSRPLSVSTTTTIAILTAAELEKVAPNGGPGELIVASATLAVLVGAMLAACLGSSSWFYRQLHIGSGTGRFQGRDWIGHRGGPGS